MSNLINSSYAGIRVDENATQTSITVTEVFTKVDVFDTNMPNRNSTSDQANNRIICGQDGDYKVSFSLTGNTLGTNKTYEWDIFKINSPISITGATQANPVVITAVGHGRSNGDYVKIDSVGGMVEINDRIFKVANKTSDTFELTSDGDVNIDGTGYTLYTTGGNSSYAVKTGTHSHRKFAVTDIGALGDSSNIDTLVDGDIIELYIKNDDDTTNFVNEHVTMSINLE